MDPKHEELLKELYLEMYDNMLSYAIVAFKDESLAEEAVQETFRIACEKSDQVYESPNPNGWLVITLKYTINNIKRTRESAQQLLSRYLALQTESSTYSVDKLSLEALYGNVAETEEFKLLTEFAVDGKSHLEMAKSRGISVAACKKRVQRAKQILKDKI